jgi:hypothetical protein
MFHDRADSSEADSCRRSVSDKTFILDRGVQLIPAKGIRDGALRIRISQVPITQLSQPIRRYLRIARMHGLRSIATRFNAFATIPSIDCVGGVPLIDCQHGNP